MPACLRACPLAHLPTRLRACAPSCVPSCVPAVLRAIARACLRVLACFHAYFLACLRLCLRPQPLPLPQSLFCEWGWCKQLRNERPDYRSPNCAIVVRRVLAEGARL
eukprot:7537575-Alexandrium_andersonii.AAC.1